MKRKKCRQGNAALSLVALKTVFVMGFQMRLWLQDSSFTCWNCLCDSLNNTSLERNDNSLKLWIYLAFFWSACAQVSPPFIWLVDAGQKLFWNIFDAINNYFEIFLIRWQSNRLVARTNPTMHKYHIPQFTILYITEMSTHVQISATKWCIVGYFSNLLWNSWEGLLRLHHNDRTLEHHRPAILSNKQMLIDDLIRMFWLKMQVLIQDNRDRFVYHRANESHNQW